MWTLRRWMARLAFSFLIIALVLAWQASRAGPQTPRWLVWLYVAGAAASAVLAAAGLRIRHGGGDGPSS